MCKTNEECYAACACAFAEEEAMYRSEASEQRAALAGFAEAVALVQRGAAGEAAAAAAIAAEQSAVANESLSCELRELSAQAAADIAEEMRFNFFSSFDVCFHAI